MLYLTQPPDTAVQVAEKYPKKHELRLTPDYLSQHESMKPPFTLKELSTEGFSLTKNYEQKRSGGIEIYVPNHNKRLITPEFYARMKKREDIKESCERLGKMFPEYCTEKYDMDMENSLILTFGKNKFKTYNISFYDGKSSDHLLFTFSDWKEGIFYGELTNHLGDFFNETGIFIPERGNETGVITLGATPFKTNDGYLEFFGKKFLNIHEILNKFFDVDEESLRITGDVIPLSTEKNDEGNMVFAGRMKFELLSKRAKARGRYMISTKGARYSFQFGYDMERIFPEVSMGLEKILGCKVWPILSISSGSKVEKKATSIMFGFELEYKK